MTSARKATRQRYARLMGDFWRHPRTAGLSPAAAGILARAWSYCADQMTDGEVPRFIIAAFFAGAPDEEVVSELIESGLWEETPDGYRMRDWADRNITKAEWEARKEAARRRVQKHRERAAAKRNAGGNALHDALPTHNVRTGNAVGNDRETHDEGRRTKDEGHPLRDVVVGARMGAHGSSASNAAPDSVDDLDEAIRRLRRLLDEASWRLVGAPLNGDHQPVREAATWIWQVVQADGRAWVTLTEALLERWERDPYLRKNRVQSLARNFLSRLATLRDEVLGNRQSEPMAAPANVSEALAAEARIAELRAKVKELQKKRDWAWGHGQTQTVVKLERQQERIKAEIRKLKGAA